MDRDTDRIVAEHAVQLSFLVGTMTEIKGALKEIIQTQSDLKVIMERQINHEENNHSEHLHIHDRINKLESRCTNIEETHEEKCDAIHPKAEKGFMAFTILKWAGAIIGGLMLTSMMARIFGIKGD